MPPERYRMFIDDTGEVDNAATNTIERRFASITGVIFEWNYYHHVFDQSFTALKFKHFGNGRKGAPPVLHRRSLMIGDGAFRCLQNEAARAAWNKDCLSMYARATFTLVTVSVDKVAFYYHHPRWQKEIYLMLVQNAIERYFYFLRGVDGMGDVMAEALSDKADKALRTRYELVYAEGTEYIQPELLRTRLTSKEIKIKPKVDNIAGLQMADLLAKPSFDHCRAKYTDAVPPRGFSAQVCDILEKSKYYRQSDGNPHSYGRVWRPNRK